MSIGASGLAVDFLIIGQGLAGTLVAHELERRNRSFHIIDHADVHSSSRLAAGVINPITGRRYVKSWMYDTLLPVALSTYQDLEQYMGCQLIRARNIIRIFPDQKQETDWLARSALPEYAKYMVDDPHLGAFALLDQHWRFGEVCESYQLEIPLLLTVSRDRWVGKGSLSNATFDPDALQMGSEIRYRGVQAGAVIFCEGANLQRNPLFRSTLLDVSRGDILLVHIPSLNADKIIKKKFFLIHLADDLYWFGAKNSWDLDHVFPVESIRHLLEAALTDLVKIPFEIIEHKAAIRPTVKDRRPILGQHPDYDNVYILNGLGTKGASLGPYWSKRLLDFILDERALEKEVDVGRYYLG